MKRALMIWAGILLALLAIGEIASIWTMGNKVGGPIVAALAAAAAWRLWYMAGEARSPQE
ncbi:MAG: hypothetical protein ACTHON_15040 [Humibacter sp.]